MNKTGKCIVIAEDDPGIVEVIKIILEEEGHTVHIASSKKDVLDFVYEKKPDIIFLDILLSGDTGKEIAMILRKDPRTSKLPIILLSANNDLESIAKDAKVTDYLQKPFEIEQLLSMIEQYTGNNLS